MVSSFEIIMRMLGYNIGLAERELIGIQCFSRDQFHDYGDQKKWDIAKFHFNNNPLYKKKIGKFFPSSWEELPIMTKQDYQKDLSLVMSNGYSRKNTYISNTSGSSGHPFFFAKNKEAHAMDWAFIKRKYQLHGLTFNSKQARFFGIPLEGMGLYKEKAKDLLMKRVRFPVFDLSDDFFEKSLLKFKKYKFEYIYGYTNSLVLFARYLLRKGLQLTNICPSLRICVTTSEVLTSEDREILRTAFGTIIVNEYGASETGIIAFESPTGEWQLSEEILFCEVIDESNKVVSSEHPGNIVITDLDNKAMPFVRYKIGDVGVISGSTRQDGLNRNLHSLLGRENDTIILPSGKTSPGLTFYYISRSILEDTGMLKEFIIRQVSKNEFVFDVVTGLELTDSHIQEIQKKMDIYLEPGLKLIVNRVKEIKRPSTGKIKHFYSEI